jgi:hypothetical protein
LASLLSAIRTSRRIASSIVTFDYDGSQGKTQPKAKAGAKKTVCLKKGPVAKKDLSEGVVRVSVIA